MKELTEKQIKILDSLKNDFDGTAFAEDMLEKHNDLTIQSIRMTLVGLASKGLVSKTKEDRDGKLLTKYTVVE